MPLNYYHRQVAKWLSAAGISYTEEYPVGPYHLDLYLPDQKLGVEIDGPHHNKAKDWERDRLIRDHFDIRIVRVPVGTKKAKCLAAILEGEE